MAYFQTAVFPSLLLSPQTATDVGYLAYLLPQGTAAPKGGIDLAPALTDTSLGGSFLFSPRPFDFGDDKNKQEAFAGQIWGVLNRAPTSRGIMWVPSPEEILGQTKRFTLPFLGLNGSGTTVTSGLSTGIGLSLDLLVSQGMNVALSNNKLMFDGSTTAARISFTGASAPVSTSATSGILPFDGAHRGNIEFQTFIQRQSLYSQWNWGFQFFFPQEGAPDDLLAEWLPLADGGDRHTSIIMIGFNASIDPADPFNVANHNKTILSFTGSNQDRSTTSFTSCYRTVNGEPVVLWPLANTGDLPAVPVAPAGLVFTHGRRTGPDQESLTASPQGDYLIDAPPSPDGITSTLLGGLHGTEFFSFTPGRTAAVATRLRFTSGQAAWAPNYPRTIASPVGKPKDLNASPLQSNHCTSWATLVPANGQLPVIYVAQPQGSPLFGHDTTISPRFTNMLGAADLGSELPTAGTSPFPIVPYTGFQAGNSAHTFSSEEAEQFETLIIAPTRRDILGNATTGMRHSSRIAPLHTTGDGSFNTTTPSGVITTVTSSGGNLHWSKILLGRTATSTQLEMAFLEPTPKLQQAFQTSQLCLVVANNLSLVDSGSGAFSNRLNIEDWIIEANPGVSPGYDDYSNILIVKGIKGALYDPNDIEGSLVANPSNWTQREIFAAPTLADSSEPPDNNQLVNLSRWLQEYFAKAAAQTDNAYFEKFNSNAKSKDWTGILVLRADITQVPEDLKGIMAGISAPSRFYAHHLGIDISQVRQDNGVIDISDESSVFGLISYTDPDYNEDIPDQPVAPTAGQDYDYRVLTLKVLFENTGITNFSSRTQLTLNRLFACPVDHMGSGGNGYNSIILNGTYQNNHGTPVYSMVSTNDWTFYFDSPVLNKVEITSAQMVTLDPGAADRDAVIWFGLAGFMDFIELSKPSDNGDKASFDIFSFGNSIGSDDHRKGLAYSNLGLQMSYPVAMPETRTFLAVTTEMAFDMQISTPRPKSLYTLFALTFDKLVTGEAGQTPKDLGYLDVVTDLHFTGVGDGPWFALRFRLDMGTPGQLAGDIGLVSTLLTAWTPEAGSNDNYPAAVNLALPGTGGGGKLISLQTVLNLSVGTLRLTYDDSADSFLLMMTEIALKFLGLLKLPPNGSTSFYLFGNPKASGSSSGLGWYAIYNNEPETKAGRLAFSPTDHAPKVSSDRSPSSTPDHI